MDVLMESLPVPAVGEHTEVRCKTFEDLVRQHGEAIYRMAYRLTGNEADAEDLAQEAILEAFRAFSQFRPGSRFDRWVYRIMTHTFIDDVRRRRRHPLESLDASDLREPLDRAPTPEELAVRGQLSAAVHAVLAALPPEYRLTAVLIDLQGLSYEEASEMMHCPVGTVRSRLHRAREMLRQRLARHLGEA